jgi:CubicO group peptidase (beta-lactamase class C family)
VGFDHVRLAAAGVLCLAAAVVAVPVRAAGGDDYAASVDTFLRETFRGKDAGMVVALVEERGTKVLGAGATGEGGRAVDGDTVFEIGSVTKTFTALLLLDAARRGEVALDDPVSKYLPPSVRVPERNGKRITLLNLAAQDSGLPFNADNHTGADWHERFATYTTDKMYAFLSGHVLSQDPGEGFRYSNIGMGLLGHAVALRAGADYERLVVDRICHPLHMDDTRVTLTPELKARLAAGHGGGGKPAGSLELPAIPGAGALRSTANDLTRYVSAHLGLAQSPLTPLIEQTHVLRHPDGKLGNDDPAGKTALPWIDQGVFNPPGTLLLGHAGGTLGYNSFVGLDLKNRRGVVVLSNQVDVHSQVVGWRILQRARLGGVEAAKMMPVREIVGLGVALEIDPGTHWLKITSVFPNSPAESSGLSAGLLVRTIEGVPTMGKTAPECVRLTRGPAGAAVRLEVVDAKGGGLRALRVTRRKFLIGE